MLSLVIIRKNRVLVWGTDTMQQKQKQHITQRANERGVFAVSRPISSEGQMVLQSISDILQPELRNAGRLFNVNTLGTTVIGFSRFSKRHKGIGPPTEQVTNEIDSSHHPIEVELGHLGIYGSATKCKLSISLISDKLIREAEAIEAVFEQRGFPLKQDPNAENGFVPHCSIALLYNDNLGHFQDDKILRRLESLTGLEPRTMQTIVLDPIKAHDII